MASLFENLSSGSSKDYTQGIQQYGNALTNQQGVVNKYTGNRGYQNALEQAKQGAAMTAGLAGQQAQQAARNAGMSKAQAAMMGANSAASAYGNNFAGQQNMAMNAGQSAVSGAQGITGATQFLPSSAMQEKNNQYNRASQNLATIGQVVGNVGGALVGLSDERMKEIVDDAQNRYGSLSKMIEGIDNYVYEYTDEAKEKYPEQTNDEINIGPMAQDLEKNPITASAVEEDANGIKHVNGTRLALDAIALISDMSKRISELEGAE
jgi:hypothetical protein